MNTRELCSGCEIVLTRAPSRSFFIEIGEVRQYAQALTGFMVHGRVNPRDNSETMRGPRPSLAVAGLHANSLRSSANIGRLVG